MWLNATLKVDVEMLESIESIFCLFMGIADIETQTATFFNKITEAVKMIPSVYSPDVCVPCAMAEVKPRKPAL